MKKLFTVLFATMLVGQVLAYDFQSGDLYYNITSDSTVAVTYQLNYSSNNYLGLTSTTIPEKVTYNEVEYAVTGISDNAFYSCSKLTSVVIPNSVSKISSFAFYGCRSLTSVKIPNSVVSIGRSAFYDCNKLHFNEYNNACYLGNDENQYRVLIKAKSADITSCEINNNCFIISPLAFSECVGLTSITISNSVAGIGESAFSSCIALTSVVIPNSVIGIGLHAFDNCSSLTSITIPNSVTGIANDAFSGCCSLTTINIESDANISNSNLCFTKDNISYKVLDKNTVVVVSNSNSGKVVIPENVTVGNTFTVSEISANAFSGCDGLTSVTIPNSVTSIGDYAFEGCNGLTSVNIPNSVTSIGAYAFRGCEDLLFVTIPKSVTHIGRQAFNSISGGDRISSNTIICCEVGSLPSSWYKGHYNSTSWNSGIGLVYWNVKMAKITNDFVYTVINDSVAPYQVGIIKYIGDSVSVNVSSKDSLDGKEYEVVSITKDAFKGYDKLVYTAFDNAFYIGNEENPYLILITAKNKEIESCEINNKCRFIYDEALSGCTNISEITIPESIISIGYNAFSENREMKSVLSYAVIPPAMDEVYFLNNWNPIIYVNPNCVDAYKDVAEWNKRTILPFGIVSAKSNNEALGVVQGDSLILGNNPLTITATPNEGYHFAGWSDGNKENPRIFTEAKDTAVTALFEAHTAVVDSAVAATCSAIGLTEGSHCSVCNAVLVAQNEIPMIEHSIVTDAAVAATVTETGLTEGSHCSVCGAVIVAQEVIPALGEQGNENTNPGTAVAELAADNLQVYAHRNTIIVENATDEIRVYNAMGALVGRDVACRVRAELQVNGAGVYIVKVGTAAKRVMIND